jgi:hypothetical protein
VVRVFATGATGFIGSAVGAQADIGTIEDVGSLPKGAARAPPCVQYRPSQNNLFAYLYPTRPTRAPHL